MLTKLQTLQLRESQVLHRFSLKWIVLCKKASYEARYDRPVCVMKCINERMSDFVSIDELQVSSLVLMTSASRVPSRGEQMGINRGRGEGVTRQYRTGKQQKQTNKQTNKKVFDLTLIPLILLFKSVKYLKSQYCNLLPNLVSPNEEQRIFEVFSTRGIMFSLFLWWQCSSDGKC